MGILWIFSQQKLHWSREIMTCFVWALPQIRLPSKRVDRFWRLLRRGVILWAPTFQPNAINMNECNAPAVRFIKTAEITVKTSDCTRSCSYERYWTTRLHDGWLDLEICVGYHILYPHVKYQDIIGYRCYCCILRPDLSSQSPVVERPGLSVLMVR